MEAGSGPRPLSVGELAREAARCRRWPRPGRPPLAPGATALLRDVVLEPAWPSPARRGCCWLPVRRLERGCFGSSSSTPAPRSTTTCVSVSGFAASVPPLRPCSPRGGWQQHRQCNTAAKCSCRKAKHVANGLRCAPFLRGEGMGMAAVVVDTWEWRLQTTRTHRHSPTQPHPALCRRRWPGGHGAWKPQARAALPAGGVAGGGADGDTRCASPRPGEKWSSSSTERAVGSPPQLHHHNPMSRSARTDLHWRHAALACRTGHADLARTHADPLRDTPAPAPKHFPCLCPLCAHHRRHVTGPPPPARACRRSAGPGRGRH